MNAAAAIYHLLTTDAGVTALVTNIGTDLAEQGVTLPALVIDEVSEVDLQTLVVEGDVFVTERIQVTGAAKTYPQLVAIMDAVKAACHARSPVITGISGVHVRADGKGARFRDDAASIQFRTQDFRVTYTKTL